MLDRVEAMKLQLAEAHKYVQGFLTLRMSIFGVYVAFVGGIIAATVRTPYDEGRATLWILLGMVHVLGCAAMISVSRAVWLFCCHMLIIERSVYGTGGNHQWLAANLRDTSTSSTHGLRIACVFLCAATVLLVLFDAWHHSTNATSTALVAIAAAITMYGAVRAAVGMDVRRIIGWAADQALATERDLATIESTGPDGATLPPDLARTYAPMLTLISHHRAQGARAGVKGEDEGMATPATGTTADTSKR